MIEKYWVLYPELYTEGAQVIFLPKVTGYYPKKVNYNHSNKFRKKFQLWSEFRDKSTGKPVFDIIIRKYPDISSIKTVILDFDAEDGNRQPVLDYMKRVSNYLEHLQISHMVEDSTNKGAHLYIFLGKSYDFNISEHYKVNSTFFNNFINKLLWEYTKYLDPNNKHLGSQIKMTGTMHYKTGKYIKPIIYKEYNNNTHKYIDYCYNCCKETALEIEKEYLQEQAKRQCKYKKYNKNGFIDLRTLPWDGVGTNDGKSLWCLCPFHADTRPSLRVYDHGAFCTAGCGKIPFSKIKEYFGLD